MFTRKAQGLLLAFLFSAGGLFAQGPTGFFFQAGGQMQALSDMSSMAGGGLKDEDLYRGDWNMRYQPFTDGIGATLTLGWTFSNQTEFSVFAGYIPRNMYHTWRDLTSINDEGVEVYSPGVQVIQYQQIPLMVSLAKNWNIGRFTLKPSVRLGASMEIVPAVYAEKGHLESDNVTVSRNKELVSVPRTDVNLAAGLGFDMQWNFTGNHVAFFVGGAVDCVVPFAYDDTDTSYNDNGWLYNASLLPVVRAGILVHPFTSAAAPAAQKRGGKASGSGGGNGVQLLDAGAGGSKSIKSGHQIAGGAAASSGGGAFSVAPSVGGILMAHLRGETPDLQAAEAAPAGQPVEPVTAPAPAPKTASVGSVLLARLRGEEAPETAPSALDTAAGAELAAGSGPRASASGAGADSVWQAIAGRTQAAQPRPASQIARTAAAPLPAIPGTASAASGNTSIEVSEDWETFYIQSSKVLSQSLETLQESLASLEGMGSRADYEKDLAELRKIQQKQGSKK